MDQRKMRESREHGGSLLTRRQFINAAGLGSLIVPAALARNPLAIAGAPERVEEVSEDKARAFIREGTLLLSNGAISAAWMVSGDKFRAVNVVDRRSGRTLRLGDNPFSIVLQGGRIVTAADLVPVGHPSVEPLAADRLATRFSDRLEGTSIVLRLRDSRTGVEFKWQGILRDGSNYIRQEVTLQATGADLPMKEIRLIELAVAGARVYGRVNGSPVVAGNMFFAFEHPLATSYSENGRVVCALTRQLPLRAGRSVAYSSVIGVARDGQLRRDFLNYVERERAHPYRTFLHYNSWYDLGYFSKYDEAGALAVIDAFGTELSVKRKTVLSSFLFDDGWDDDKTLWHFNSGFPDGFTKVKLAAAKYNAAPGVWMSPWGGYGKPKEERLKYGREQGFETNAGGFALSGPKYYRRFRDTCVDMIRNYGVNQFKFDGTGNADRVIAGSDFDSDFDAAINLIGELRAQKRDLYVNLTTGTYPSPFWLRYADSIWRGGEDHDFAGVGTSRQQWITYRDAQTFKNVVNGGPLFPLNSLMLHGLVYARYAKKLDTDPGNDFRDEIRAYFGNGTQLQEMYITPSLLSGHNWGDLAEAANWSRGNADVLKDTHWVGGDPAALEIYGWASWSQRKGILVLRNPGEKPQSITLDIGQAFELPSHANGTYSARSPWQESLGRPPMSLEAGNKHSFTLKPFEIVTLEAAPSH